MSDIKLIAVLTFVLIVLYFGFAYYEQKNMVDMNAEIVWTSEAPTDRPKVELGMRADGVVTWRDIKDAKDNDTQ